jgi:DNA-binding NarL/FixJ family response regulator
MPTTVVPQSGSPGSPEIDTSTPFTTRELEIVGLVVEGCTNAEIAGVLHISPRTVQAHLASAMRKVRVTSRTQLAVTALRTGCVGLHPAGPLPVAA